MGTYVEIVDMGEADPARPPLTLTFSLSDDHSNCPPDMSCDKPHWQSLEEVNGISLPRRHFLYVDHLHGLLKNIYDRAMPGENHVHDRKQIEDIVGRMCPQHLNLLIQVALERFRDAFNVTDSMLILAERLTESVFDDDQFD